MLLTIVTVTFSAKFFGVSVEKDVWVLSSTFLTTISMAVWGPINEIFRAKFVFIKEKEGVLSALNKTSSLIGFISVATFIIIILLFIFAEPIANLLIEDMAPSAKGVFVLLLILMAPTLLITELGNIGICVLNAYDVYYLPEIVGFASGLVNLVAIIAFAPVLGIYSLMIANYFGGLLLLIVVLYFLNKRKIHLWGRMLRFNWGDVKIFLIFALPFFFPYFVGQINGLLEKYLSGMLGSGMISSLDYSKQFISVLQSVLSSVLTTLFVPILAKHFINKQRDEFYTSFRENMVISSLIVCLASIFLIGVTEPLCKFFFFRGKLSFDALNIIITLTRMFGIAFWGVLAYMLFGYASLASNQGKFYATIGVANQIVVLLVNILAVPRYGVYVFPITYGVIHLLSGIVMFCYLEIDNKIIIAFTFTKSFIVSLCFSWCYLMTIKYIQDYNVYTQLILVCCSMVLTIPITAQILGINVKQYALNIYYKYARK